MEEGKKSGFCALIGRPNVGKSTLMNRLIGQKIAITSPRPQTTRMRIRTVLNDERGQVVFVDTPGIHESKNRLGDYMLSAVQKSLKEADLILWLVEPRRSVSEKDRDIAEQLGALKVPCILVINKTDTIPPAEQLPVIAAYKELCAFTDIVPLSALKGDNVDVLTDCIFRALPVGPYYFGEDEVTDQTQRSIAAELIREKALRLLDKEVPHGIAVVIERFEYRRRSGGGIYDIDATIICEKASHKGIIIGKGGAMLKKIGEQARAGIEDMTGEQVNLKLWVKPKENWRDSDFLIANFGYRKEDQ